MAKGLLAIKRVSWSRKKLRKTIPMLTDKKKRASKEEKKRADCLRPTK